MGQDQDIRRYLNALVRRWWVVVALSIAIGSATYFLTPTKPPSFRASSTLDFGVGNQQPGFALPFATGLNPPGNNLSSQVVAIKGPEVLRIAANKVLATTGAAVLPPNSAQLLSEIRDLENDISADEIRNSVGLVRITANAPTGGLAAARANAVAEAYLEQSASEQAEAISARLDSITRQIDGLQVARNQASSVDPQNVADLENQVAVVGEDISDMLVQLESLRVSGLVGDLSVDILTSLSATLEDVTTDLQFVEANLLLLADRKSEVKGTGAAVIITSGLIASAELLDRSAAQLDGLDAGEPEEIQIISAQLSSEVGDAVLQISESLIQAADNLRNIDESSLASQGLLGQAKVAADESTDAIRSTYSLVNDVLANPGPLVNESILTAARDSLSSLDNDVIRLISRMRFLSEGEAAAGQTGERQQIVNQFQAIQAEIGVIVVDIRFVRGQETGSLNIGSMQTAEVQAQVANNAIDDAIAALQNVGQANAVVGITEIEDKLRLTSGDVLGLPKGVAALESAGEGSEQLILELLAEVTAMDDSLGIAVQQIQARRVTETDSETFIPLFVAESRAIEAHVGLTAIKNEIENLANPSGALANLVALKNLANDMTRLATGLRLLDSQYGGSLELGAIGAGELIELSDRAGTHSATLDLIILSLPALRTSITNVETYGIIRNSENRTLEAQRELSVVVGQLNQLTGATLAVTGAVRLSDVQERAAQISNTVALAKDDLDDLISTVGPGESVLPARLMPLGDRIVASGEILLSLSQSVALLRASESDVEARAKLISVEDQLQASSMSLAAVSSSLTQLSVRPNALVDQSIRDASDEGRTAADAFNSAGERLRPIRDDINAGTIIRPDRFILIGQDFRNLEQSTIAVSAYLAQAEANESLPVIQVALAAAIVNVDALGLKIGATSDAFEAIGLPSAAEATLYAQLLDSQRQLQLGRLIFDTSTVSILETATKAVSTGGADETKINGIVGLTAGLLLGLVIVVMLEYMDKRLRGQEDIKRQLGLSPLGVVPIATGVWNPHPQITVDTPPSSFSESMRMVRTAVDIGRRQASAQVLVVTSPREGDGKTTMALNLARSMAMENKKVLLVDGNLHTPEVASAFQLEEQRGLSNALKTNSPPADYVVEVDGVHILPGGDPVDSPVDVLAMPSFQEFLRESKDIYDVILLDSPPAIGYADTVILARNADGVIFTYRARHTSAGDAEEASEIMRALGTPTVGVILNMADDKDSGVVFPKTRRASPHPPPTPGWRSPWSRIKSRLKKRP